MALRKLTSTDGFVVIDLPVGPASGVVRRAKKILQGSAKDLARSATYTFASFGMERSGASAGINAVGDTVSDAVQAFVSELLPSVTAGELHLEAGKGLTGEQLSELRAAAGDVGPIAGSETVLIAGVVAATKWALGGDLAGKSVAIEGAKQAPAALQTAFTEAGATVIDVWGVDEKPWLVWGAAVDAIVAGSKPGTLNHQGADLITTATAVIPWGPIPTTTKAFAQLQKAGSVTVVPDFVSTAGYLLSGFIDGGEAAVASAVTRRITDVLEEAGSHSDGVLLGACYLAETFIQSWLDEKPFGRPLAA